MHYDRDELGQAIGRDPAVQVTLAGLETVVEADKSWLRKAIDKQPVAFLQVIVTVLIALLTFGLGLAVGRYSTPAPGATPPAVTEQGPGRAPPNGAR